MRLESVSFNDQTYLLSAYVDMRAGNMGKPSLRIVAVTQHKFDFYCIFPDGTRTTEPGTYYEMAENHAKRFGVYFLSFPLPHRYMHNEPLDRVEIGRQDSDNQSQAIYISGTVVDSDSTEHLTDYGICLPFLFGKRYTVENVAETVEFAKLTGAQQLYFYVDFDATDSKLLQLLDYYASKGVATVIQYRSPVVNSMIWYHGQLITITDCLYRNAGRTRLLTFHDLDEFVVPYTKDTVAASLQPLLDAKPNIAGFRLPTQYHGLHVHKVPISVNNLRANSGLDLRFTKCIVRPERVFEQGIHHVSRVIQDKYEVQSLTNTKVLLHHYKGTGRGDDEYPRVRDVYGAKLRENIKNTLEQLKKTT